MTEDLGRTDADAGTDLEEGLSLVQLRKQFTDFASVKLSEINESREARRYYHGDQLTKEQRETLRKRGQPAIIFNRTARKVNGLVGVVQKLRNDPKAYPRTERGQAGADLATATLRYVLDTSRWIDTERQSVLDASTSGIGVGELSLVQGDHQDPDIRFDYVDPITYFYDPRSVKADFSDIRYDGVSRWVSQDELEELFPDAADVAQDSSGYETTPYDFDREFLWINERKRIRLVEHWYKHRGVWKWCIYANWTKLAHGVSPFYDERGATRSRYVKFSMSVDQDGDRYGFIRAMKGPQDAINQHRSKAMHIMNTRQGWGRKGVFEDTERARRELARPDGWLEPNGEQGKDWGVLTQDQDFLKQTQYFQDAKEEIENYGPSPAIVGTNVNQRSGRALAMMQQNGIAELGPFLGNYRHWKLETYRAIWNACRAHWQSERYIRITDDEEVARFIKINELQIGPSGLPQIINQLGALDVDIILDEGPDTTNVMGDVNDVLMALAQGATDPSDAKVLRAQIIETSALPKAVKDRLTKMMHQPPSPEAVQAQQIQLAHGAAKVEDTRASAMKKQVEAARVAQEVKFAPAVLMHDMTRDIEDTAHRQRDFMRGMFLDGAGLALKAHAQTQPPQQAAE